MYCQIESKHKEWRTRIKTGQKLKASYCTKQNKGNKAGTTNLNGTNEGKTLEIKNYRMKIEEKEEEHL